MVRRGKRLEVESARRASVDGVEERLLDVREAAALLGLKPATLYQWAYRRRIPVVKLFGPRGALRFRLRDVQQLIQDSLRPAIPRSGPSQ
jgi:excisionase family DNA binding protein